MDISNVNAKTSAVLGKISSIIGYVFGLLFFALTISYMDDGDIEMSIVSAVIFIISILLILKGAQTKRRIARLKKYNALIYGQQIFTLDKIAASTSRSLDFVKQDLQSMIDKRYLFDIEIDWDANRVIAGSETARAQHALQAKLDKFENFICPGCGASGVKPKGEYKTCEYCGRTV